MYGYTHNIFCDAQVLGLSSRSWLQYAYQGRQQLSSLSYEAIDYASGFSSEQCPEGIVAIAGNSLRYESMHQLSSGLRCCVSIVQY